MVAVETTYQWNKRLIDVLAGQAEKNLFKTYERICFLKRKTAKQRNDQNKKKRMKWR